MAGENTRLPVSVVATAGAPFRVLTQTVGEAIAAVQALPAGDREKHHWRDVMEKLDAFRAQESPKALSEANVSLQRALHLEGWSA